MTDYDLIIVGSGLVGASLACALANTPLKLAIIDAKPLKPLDKTHSRPLSLTHASYRILKNLNLWNDIAQNATPIEHIHVSERGRFGAVHMHADEMNVSALGYVADIVDIFSTLQHHIQQQKNLDIIQPATVEKIHFELQNAHVTLQQKNTQKIITAPLVIAADGSHSSIRHLLGIPEKNLHYDQIALSATVQFSRTHNNTAYERFTKAGTLALLPRPGQKCGMVWTMPSAQKENYIHLSDEDFLQYLQDNIGYRLGKCETITPRNVFPLQGTQALERIRPHVLVLGNASQTLHPAAAQGFNLGLNDAAAFVDILHEACEQNTPLHDYRLLQRFDQWRTTHQQKTLRLTNTLVKTFSSKHPFVRCARHIGLLHLAYCPYSKHKFAEFGMGHWGRRPTLAY